jgi:transcriptional regulator with XRE-family HTH domain
MNHLLRKALGANVRSLLETRRMSQSSLATAIGKSQGTISQIIHGRTSVPIDTIEAIAEALRVSPAMLLARQPGAGPRGRTHRDSELLSRWRAASPGVRDAVVDLVRLTTDQSQAADFEPRAVKLVATLVELLSQPVHRKGARILSSR